MSKPNKRDDRFCGATKGRANIEIVINQHRDLLSFKSQNPVEFHAATRRATTFLVEKKKQHSDTRIQAKVDSFVNSINNSRAPNRFERMTGYTRTERSEGKVQVGKLRKGTHLRAIELELEARGIVYDPKETWTKKKERLLEDEGDSKYFIPRTSIEAFSLSS